MPLPSPALSPSPSTSPSPSWPSAPDRICTHMHKMDMKLAADSAEKTESEICSPWDSIVYLASRIWGCNGQHHDMEASWHLVVVEVLWIRFRLPCRLTSWFHPTYTVCHMPHTTDYMPPAPRCLPYTTSLPPPRGSNAASLWNEHAGVYVGAIVMWDWKCLHSWECTGECRAK